MISLVYPKGCERFNGPHSPNCLIALFQKAGCLRSGEGYPGGMMPSQMQSEYGGMSLP